MSNRVNPIVRSPVMKLSRAAPAGSSKTNWPVTFYLMRLLVMHERSCHCPSHVIEYKYVKNVSFRDQDGFLKVA